MGWIEASFILFGGLIAVMAVGLPVAFAFLAINIIGAWIFLGGESGMIQFSRNAVTSACWRLCPLAARARIDNASANPEIHRNAGKMVSANVQPCQPEWTSGAKVLAGSPGLFTRIIATMAAPRNTSRE